VCTWWKAALPSALLLLTPLAGRTAGAQGAVGGRITILERSGVRTTDLANAVVYLEPAAGARALGTATTQIVMESREFVPRVRVVTVGSTVEFPNQDPFRHNVFSNTGPAAFDLGLYERGASKGATLRQAGVYPVFCNIHARMVAFVLAIATPYFTQAGADGRFTVANVPAGRYTLRAWHDRGGEQARQLDVPAAGVSDVSVELDARGYRPVPHKNKFGQEYTTAGRDRY
jgi:plastocyanin